jgi:hypothetical protein
LQQRWRDDVSLWQRRHDYLLLQAVLQEGYGKWKEIMKYAILLYLLSTPPPTPIFFIVASNGRYHINV